MQLLGGIRQRLVKGLQPLYKANLWISVQQNKGSPETQNATKLLLTFVYLEIFNHKMILLKLVRRDPLDDVKFIPIMIS